MWNYSDRYSVQLFEYPNTIRVAKNPNTEYRILLGIGKSQIPNTNTTIRSNYSNSIRIPNYSSHPGPILVRSQISINCRYADAQLFSRLQLHAASRWPCFLGPQLLGERPSRCQKSASLHLSKKLFHLVWWGLSLSPLMYHLFPDQNIDWQLSLSLSLPLQGLKIRLAFMPGFLYALFSEKWVRGDPLRCCLLRMLPCPLFANLRLRKGLCPCKRFCNA